MTGAPLEHISSWASGFRLRDVPQRVREHAKNQVFSMLGAVHSGHASDLGPVLERSFPGDASDPVRSAMLMSAWSMALDYDDVMLGGHTGHFSVLVPLAFAQANGLSGTQLLEAQIAANEIAARINMAAALGPTRGQMATHLHVIGAACAFSHVRELRADRFAQALALACSYPSKALHAAFLGSDAKALCAAWPIRCGLDAVDAATAGLRGSSNVVDGVGGLLRSLSPAPRLEFLEGIGERWHTETNSYKTHPGSAYLQAAVEATEQMVTGCRVGLRPAKPGVAFLNRGPGRPEAYPTCATKVRSIDVYCSLLTAGMEAQSQPYLIGPGSCVATLCFSTAYAVACAAIFGGFGPEHLRANVRANPHVWETVRKVRVHHDPELTIEALQADIPIGAALMNARRRDRLRFLMTSGHQDRAGHSIPVRLRDKLRIAARLCLPAPRPVPPDFSAMKKPLGARVVLTLESGETCEERVGIPGGFAGGGDWTVSRRLMRTKYIKCASENIGWAAAQETACLIDCLEELQPRNVERLASVTLCPHPALDLRR